MFGDLHWCLCNRASHWLTRMRFLGSGSISVFFHLSLSPEGTHLHLVHILTGWRFGPPKLGHGDWHCEGCVGTCGIVPRDEHPYAQIAHLFICSVNDHSDPARCNVLLLELFLDSNNAPFGSYIKHFIDAKSWDLSQQ
jgi:hypothetical protein